MNGDRTLNSPEFDVWRIVAMESGMSPSDIESVSKTRLRLIAAATVCREVVSDTPPAMVSEVFREVCLDADRHDYSSLDWPIID